MLTTNLKSKSDLQNKLFYQLGIYLVLANSSFYQIGNSNSLSTVNVNACFIGLDSYQFILPMFFGCWHFLYDYAKNLSELIN